MPAEPIVLGPGNKLGMIATGQECAAERNALSGMAKSLTRWSVPRLAVTEWALKRVSDAVLHL